MDQVLLEESRGEYLQCVFVCSLEGVQVAAREGMAGEEESQEGIQFNFVSNRYEEATHSAPAIEGWSRGTWSCFSTGGWTR